MVGLLSENRRSLVYGLTDGMQLIADCFASLERIESFLLVEELNGKELNQQEDTTGNENGDEKEKDNSETVEKPFLKVQGYVILLIKLVFFFRRCTLWTLSSAETQRSFFRAGESVERYECRR